MRSVLWIILAPGCLWIGPDAHEARMGGSTPSTSASLPTGDTGRPELGLSLVEPLPTVDACAPPPQLEGTVDPAWSGVALEATLTVGSVVDAFDLVADADGGFREPLPLPEVACTSPCPVDVVLSVAEPEASVRSSLVVDPPSAPSLVSALLDGVDVVGGGAVAYGPDDALDVVLDGRRLGETTGLALRACFDGATPDAGCEALEGAVSVTSSGLSATVPATALGQAACDAPPDATLVVWFEGVHPCEGDLALPLTGELTLLGDCDQDGAMASDDCDDRDADRAPGQLEQCDEVDRDCSGDPYDVVTTSEGGQTVARPSAQLQDALDAASAGDTVTLCGGTVEGAFVLPEGVQLVATHRATLDGAGAGPVVSYLPPQGPPEQRPQALLQNLDIVGGVATEGAGVKAVHANLRLVDVTLSGHTASLEGGGLFVEGSEVALDGVRIEANTAQDGGGLLAKGAEVSATDLVVAGNTATDDGGGVLLRDALLDLDATSSLEGNVATRGGGAALALKQTSGRTELVGGSVTGNDAEDGGGVAVVTHSGELVAVTSDVTSNTAVRGAGLYLAQGLTEVEGLDLNSNSASSSGDAAYVDTGASLMLSCVGLVDGIFVTSAGIAQPPPVGGCGTLDGAETSWTDTACTCP